MSAKPIEPLLPVRYKQPDLFSIDITAISVKDAHQHMEHPFFVLTTRPDTRIRKYKDSHGNSIDVIPSSLGMPTILDKDVLIYAISHIIHRKNRGEPVSRRVVIYSADMLRFANRCQSGRDYAALERSLRRLVGCLIQTNIRTADTLDTKMFSLLESADLRRKYDTRGRLMHCEITLSKWLWRAIQADEILTLHPNYFRLRRPLERRLYEIARKHCGAQPSWNIGLARLHQKCAAQCALRYFRFQIRQIAATGALPDYAVEYEAERDQVQFLRRADPESAIPDEGLDNKTYQKALALAPDDDIRDLHRQWRAWARKNTNSHSPASRKPLSSASSRALLRRQENAMELGKPPPRPDAEHIDPNALAWWNALPSDKRGAFEQKFRVFRVQDEDLFRSDKGLIEYAHYVAGPRRN